MTVRKVESRVLLVVAFLWFTFAGAIGIYLYDAHRKYEESVEAAGGKLPFGLRLGVSKEKAAAAAVANSARFVKGTHPKSNNFIFEDVQFGDKTCWANFSFIWGRLYFVNVTLESTDEGKRREFDSFLVERLGNPTRSGENNYWEMKGPGRWYASTYRGPKFITINFVSRESSGPFAWWPSGKRQ